MRCECFFLHGVRRRSYELELDHTIGRGSFFYLQDLLLGSENGETLWIAIQCGLLDGQPFTDRD